MSLETRNQVWSALPPMRFGEERPLGLDLDETTERQLVARGNRRADKCESCSRLYAADTFQLIRAGIAGGKTVPETVAGNPLVFATLTAPPSAPSTAPASGSSFLHRRRAAPRRRGDRPGQSHSPQVVAEALSVHLEEFAPGEDGSLFTTRFGAPYRRDYCGTQIFSKAVARSGLPKSTTSHDLRHHYASVLLAQGESIIAVAERLGTTTPLSCCPRTPT